MIIFLTNDSLYWKEKRESEAYGNDFSMEEGNHECETKKWKDRDRVIQLIIDTAQRRAAKGDAFRS